MGGGGPGPPKHETGPPLELSYSNFSVGQNDEFALTVKLNK